jgi:hypothetical protein
MRQVRSIVAALISGLAYTPGFVRARYRVQANVWLRVYGGRSVETKPDAIEPWYCEYPPAGVEPPLAEVLSDPIVELLMRADHLVPEGPLPAAIVAEPPTFRGGRSLMSGQSRRWGTAVNQERASRVVGSARARTPTAPGALGHNEPPIDQLGRMADSGVQCRLH